MAPIKVLFSAISGYGYYYLKTFFEEVNPERATLVGVIDPQPEKSGHYPRILSDRVPVFQDCDSFFAQGGKADLTVISSPIQYHMPQTISALRNGSNVLVDKPLGADPAEVHELLQMLRSTDRWVEVGYQWSFSDPIRKLKADILNNRYGRMKRMKAICLWPRPYEYFNRNNWAGRIRMPDGTLVLDSIANNACAHFLHNLFYLSGSAMNTSSVPAAVEGIRYRAYPVENFDTLMCRAITESDVEVFFFASHVTENSKDPAFEIDFDGGQVILYGKSEGIVGSLSDGTVIRYGNPDSDHQFKKLFLAINRCMDTGPSICPPQAALSQTRVIYELNQLPSGIGSFPADQIMEEPDRKWVRGLGDRLLEHYRDWSI
jgi:predicted dehydrogenase